MEIKVSLPSCSTSTRRDERQLQASEDFVFRRVPVGRLTCKNEHLLLESHSRYLLEREMFLQWIKRHDEHGVITIRL